VRNFGGMMDTKGLIRIIDMKPTPIKCKNTEPYTTRALAGEFTWLVYNRTTGYIVAATYDETMAKTILIGIENNPMKYFDKYGICETWKSPEPMV
jgi:hypothetical protein